VRDVRTGRTFYIYPNNTNSLYDNRYYNDRPYYDNRRRNYGNTNNRPVITDQQRKDQREKADESRKKILGKKN
jgi:hypothetical protein